MDSEMNDMFPKDIFGDIPNEVSQVLKDNGFDNLVSLITLTETDISEIEIGAGAKLKLGHKRFIMQMVDYAQKVMGKKMDAKKIQAAESSKLKNLKSVSVSEITNHGNEELKRGLKRKFDRDENITTILQQSLKKTAAKFCLENKIDSILPPLVNIHRLGDSVHASLSCVCGGESVNVYPHSTKGNWVTSNYLRHLNRFHIPDTNGNKITDFLKPSSSDNSSKTIDERNAVNFDSIEVITVNDDNLINSYHVIYQEPEALPEANSIESQGSVVNNSGELNGGMGH